MDGVAATPAVRLSSMLPESYRSAVERLMFFNPGQARAIAGIRASIDRYGVPEVVVQAGSIRICVGALGEAQSLFALMDGQGAARLVGIVVFFRITLDEIVILHLAADREFAAFGRRADALIVVRLIQAVRHIAGRLGVRHITWYPAGTPVRVCA